MGGTGPDSKFPKDWVVRPFLTQGMCWGWQRATESNGETHRADMTELKVRHTFRTLNSSGDRQGT